MKTRGLLLLSLALLTLLRWMWLAPQELPPSGAYLALCGHSPSVAYFDGPGATAVGVALGTQWAGANALGAALLWPVFAALATLAIYLLVAPLIGRPGAAAAAVLLNLLPAFNAAALYPTCAMPVTMFALGFAACAWRALETSAIGWWLGVGTCAAGGLLFGYLASFFLPALAVVMLASHRWRPQFLEPGFWLALILPLAVLASLIVWNMEHGWVHFIGGTWQTATTLDLRRVPQALASAAFGASPFVLPALAVGLWFALRHLPRARPGKFLALPAFLAALIAAYLALQGSPAEAAGLVASALAIPLVVRLPAPPAVVAVLFFGAALWTAGGLALRQPSPPAVTAGVVREIEALRTAGTTDPAAPVFLVARDAALASALALHLPDTSFVPAGHPPVYVVESPYADSQFSLWPKYDQFVEAPQPGVEAAQDPFTEQDGINPFLWRSALYITPQKAEDLPQAITAAFANNRLLAEITTPSGQILRVYLCSEYETMPL